VAKSRHLLGKPTAFDYLVMIGLPIAFVGIAFWGIVSLMGPAPPANPVSLLKKGVVKIGMTRDQVTSEVGEPKSIESSPDGTFSYVYHRGTEEPFVEEDATVSFNADGFVRGVSFQKTAVPLPGG
jgi:hypothetical protein